MAPSQALLQEEFVDAAALDRDAFVLVEIVPQAIERPAAEGEAQLLRIGQGRGDDLGPLLGGVGPRAAGSTPVRQAGEAAVVEAMDPGIDGGAGDAEVARDLGRAPALGDGQQDLGPLDEPGLGSARGRELFEGLALLGGQLAEREWLGGRHGCTSLSVHPCYAG
jgi:hypothetical protein